MEVGQQAIVIKEYKGVTKGKVFSLKWIGENENSSKYDARSKWISDNGVNAHFTKDCYLTIGDRVKRTGKDMTITLGTFGTVHSISDRVWINWDGSERNPYDYRYEDLSEYLTKVLDSPAKEESIEYLTEENAQVGMQFKVLECHGVYKRDIGQLLTLVSRDPNNENAYTCDDGEQWFTNLDHFKAQIISRPGDSREDATHALDAMQYMAHSITPREGLTFRIHYQKGEAKMASRATQARIIREETIPEKLGKATDILAEVEDLKLEATRLETYKTDTAEKRALIESLVGPEKAATIKALESHGMTIPISVVAPTSVTVVDETSDTQSDMDATAVDKPAE